MIRRTVTLWMAFAWLVIPYPFGLCLFVISAYGYGIWLQGFEERVRGKTMSPLAQCIQKIPSGELEGDELRGRGGHYQCSLHTSDLGH
jgi:hypothetical protein